MTEASILKRFAPSLLPLLVLIVGVFTAANDASATAMTDWRVYVQVAVLVVTTGAAYLLPLLPSGWRGAFKVGAPILGAILSAVLLALPIGEHVTKASVLLLLTAIIKAVATQLGVVIRADEATPSALGAKDALVEGDGLSNPSNPSTATVNDAPKHLA